VEQIRFELDLLDFLGKHQAPVAYPLPTNENSLTFAIDSPEGERLAALFPYADGDAPGKDITAAQSRLLGTTVAGLHRVVAPFSTTHTRPTLHLPYLLDESIVTIAPFVNLETGDYLASIQRKLHDVIPMIPRDEGTFGICIGDVNASNFHINDQQKVTLFDFDQCGYGYRAFEIGKFNASIAQTETKHGITKAFIQGYDQVRPLIHDELKAIPYFEIVALIWVMAIHAHNADRIGHKWLEQPFWDRHAASIKKLEPAVFGN
jgi:Ser/Thr protein kinase RdoA (MazF antagonist)